jgi:glycosyltransferase involved in cell wall biosynthesis
MEAMAMGSPPISTPISGIPELIDHEQSGLLIKPRNPEAIAQAIVRLMESDSMWNELRQHGRKKVCEEFNITTEVAKLEQTFEAAQRDTTSTIEKRGHPTIRG